MMLQGLFISMDLRLAKETQRWNCVSIGLAGWWACQSSAYFNAYMQGSLASAHATWRY